VISWVLKCPVTVESDGEEHVSSGRESGLRQWILSTRGRFA
jgi:hypothetical protein